jgi:uncharacterized membrane protein
MLKFEQYDALQGQTESILRRLFMKIVKLALKRETATPVLALVFASGVNVVLVLARMIWAWNLGCGFLIWNLFLAWLPLAFSLLACEEYERATKRNWRFWGLAGGWLVFFPNAPYIFTDLFHLRNNPLFHSGVYFWVDMVLILSSALTGLVLGFLSLYLMQSVVTRRFGRLASWGFILVVALLGSFGICLGRFLRFNSWDVLVRPVELGRGIGAWVISPLAHPATLAFPLLFATFLFIAYLMLYALTHLQQAQPLRASP